MEALQSAAAKLPTATYKYTLEFAGPTHYESRGHVDPVNKAASVSIGRFRKATVELFRMEVLVSGEDSWIQITQPASSSKKWMHLPAKELKLGDDLDELATDPTGLDGWLSAVSEVTFDGELKFKGTVDLTKASAAAERAAQIGEAARAIPFTATRDAEGRLTSFIVDFSAITNTANDELTLRYYGFGSPLSVSAPPSSEVIELPDGVLERLR